MRSQNRFLVVPMLLACIVTTTAHAQVGAAIKKVGKLLLGGAIAELGAQAVEGAVSKAEARRSDGFHGNASVEWDYDGIVHSAKISMNGKTGIAHVTGDGFSITEELTLEKSNRSETGYDYILVGSNVSHPATYWPDIFGIKINDDGGYVSFYRNL